MQSTTTRLPDVIGIGCRRCGSSMLHDALNKHAEISKPPRGLHFFSEQFGNGDEWYAEQLARHDHGRVAVEFSVSYTYPEYYEAAADRMHRLVPDARLFVIVRNPLDRAYSDYLRSVRLCEIDQQTTFEEALERYPVLLDRGRYHRLLAPYLNLFPGERVLILLLDELKSTPDRFWKSLWDFVGVDTKVRPTDAKNRIVARSVRRAALNRSVFAAKSVCDGAAGKLGLTSAWNGIKRFGNASYRRLLAMNTVSVEMKTKTRERLAADYRDDIRAMECLTGRSLDNWLDCGAN